MLFNHKVYIQYATKFFTLKLDIYKKITKQKKFTKFRGGNTEVTVQGKPCPSLRNGTVQF